MVRRRDAAQATLDAYRGKPLAYGRHDCARMAAMALRHLGYKPGLAKAGAYNSAAGALRALKRRGFDSLPAALDAIGLPRIAFAAGLPADIVQLRSDGHLDALGVLLGNGRVLAFSPHDGRAGVAQLNADDVLCCWKVSPWQPR